MGVTLAAGNSLSWYRDTFAEGVDFSELLADIGEVSPGADGLLFTLILLVNELLIRTALSEEAS